MKRILIAATAASLTAGTAFAGSLDVATPEPVPMAPIAPAPAYSADWTGPSVGISFGNLTVDSTPASENGAVYGAFAGYDYDFGDVVVGGELEYNATNDMTVAGTDVDSITRVKVRGGYDFGRTLVYATAGAAQIKTSIGDATGPFGGVGLEYRVSDSFSVGGEMLTHKFEDIGSTGLDADADTVTMRGTFRF